MGWFSEDTPKEKAEKMIIDVYGNDCVAIDIDSFPESKEPFKIIYSVISMYGRKIDYRVSDEDSEIFPFVFDKETVIKAFMKCKHDVKKTVEWLMEYANEENRKKELKRQIKKLREAEENKKIREEAEKVVYGKINPKRGPISYEERQVIYQKYNNECVVCTGKENLHIHHRDKDATNNDMKNLTLLCGVCHKKAHRRMK